MVEGDGFEPSKSKTTDLQSAPFGHSGTPPYNFAGLQQAINLLHYTIYTLKCQLFFLKILNISK